MFLLGLKRPQCGKHIHLIDVSNAINDQAHPFHDLILALTTFNIEVGRTDIPAPTHGCCSS